ncbi:hypothetical protein GpartN1_g1122.t1 [Galdieria partita]|uniref:Rubredoxin-like domain-containing protein n=1 Tax=Galdieria partita TaxID=83374 RepID=A0A9C7PT30_9RHOD|nr:hypothetical protein GpartN1_g1122.t1 [Galdieria partita]
MILFVVSHNCSFAGRVLCQRHSKTKEYVVNSLKLSVLGKLSFSKRHLLLRLHQFSEPAKVRRRCIFPGTRYLNVACKDEQRLSESEEERLARKREEVERLRAAEKFIRKDEGKFGCPVCEYVYEPDKGDALAGIKPGTSFDNLPETFRCPVCRSSKDTFIPKQTVIAGFATNQSYGFGSNALTPGQKNALIFGGLFLLFVLLMAGYGLS